MAKELPYSKNTYAYRKRKRAIVFLFTTSGLNCIISSILSFWTCAEVDNNLLCMGLVLIGLIPIIWIDKRKENNSNTAVILSAAMHLFIAVMCMLGSDFWLMLVVYLLEICVFWLLGISK